MIGQLRGYQLLRKMLRLFEKDGDIIIKYDWRKINHNWVLRNKNDTKKEVPCWKTSLLMR